MNITYKHCVCSVSRAVTKGLLLHLGCDVTSVSSSSECLQAMSSSQKHKLVFVDVCMAGADGYEVAVQVHQRFTKRPLIVALTGNADKGTRENCMRSGMDGVILKPVSLDKMKCVVSDLLEHRMVFDGI